MPAVFEYRHRVAAEEIDALGHANNVAYLQWMQAAALAHSAAQAGRPNAIRHWAAAGSCRARHHLS